MKITSDYHWFKTKKTAVQCSIPISISLLIIALICIFKFGFVHFVILHVGITIIITIITTMLSIVAIVVLGAYGAASDKLWSHCTLIGVLVILIISAYHLVPDLSEQQIKYELQIAPKEVKDMIRNKAKNKVIDGQIIRDCYEQYNVNNRFEAQQKYLK